MPEKNGIGWAVKQLHNGSRVCRAGWNGRGMYLWLVTRWSLDGETDGYTRLPFVAMKTADDMIVPWLCSQTDLLAVDWEIAT